MPDQENRWWERRHPDYQAMLPRWQRVWAHYQANIDVLRARTTSMRELTERRQSVEMGGKQITTTRTEGFIDGRFLVRRRQGESQLQFLERLELADYTPLLATVLDAYAGRSTESEKRITRRWSNADESPGLGDEKDASTIAGAIWMNADGAGTNYPVLLQRVATLLVTKQKFYTLIEGKRSQVDGEGRRTFAGHGRITIMHPDAVPNYIERDGRLIETHVTGSVERHLSVKDEPVRRTVHTVYGLTGYETWELDGDTNEIVRVDAPTMDAPPTPYGASSDEVFQYRESAADPTPILPIFATTLGVPSGRYPADILAAKNGVYFNQESERDNKLRLSNTPRLELVAPDLETKGKIEDDLSAGSNVLWLPPDSTQRNGYVEPTHHSIEVAGEVLKEKRETFLFTAFRQFEDSSRGAQMTATESAQIAAQGEHSFLNLVVAALDEWETQVWKRLEQVEYPDDPSRWGQFFVERKRDFRPMDEEAEGKRLRDLFFGSSPVPVGAMGRRSAARRIADLEDIEADDEEIEAEVEAAPGQGQQQETNPFRLVDQMRERLRERQAVNGNETG